MAINSPQDLMAMELQHIQDAETEAARALGDLRGQVQNPQLKDCLQRRMDEGEEVLRGVRECLSKFDGQSRAGDGQNKAARGIIEEGRTFMREVQAPEMKEAIAIGSIQALEHYCIATWGTVKALAEEMGERQVVQVMERALQSGKELDRRLTEIAESRVNPRATQRGGEGPQARA
jgi:ferritin-like metal-binding protein YciE